MQRTIHLKTISPGHISSARNPSQLSKNICKQMVGQTEGASRGGIRDKPIKQGLQSSHGQLRHAGASLLGYVCQPFRPAVALDTPHKGSCIAPGQALGPVLHTILHIAGRWCDIWPNSAVFSITGGHVKTVIRLEWAQLAA